MKPTSRHRQGKGASELVEETVHLLRTNPVRALASYYIGSLPFVLGLLYFWADMSRSAFASQHVAEAALGLAGLFVWMKTWQAMFARQLLDTLTGNSPPLTWRRLLRTFIAQAALQPTALFVVPLASLPILPVAWVYAFYQNVTVFGADETGAMRALISRAGRQAALWPRQNHAILSVLCGFGLFVFVNWATVALLLPLALKTLFGVESVFSRSPLSMLNTTFFAVTAGLSYLCIDPMVKAAYALRCFYGESLSSGADLRAELRQRGASAPVIALVVLLFLPVVSPCQESGQAPPATLPAHSATIAPQQLDRAISEVLQERKYTWRLPREKVAEAQAARKGIIGRFIDQAVETLKGWATKFAGWLTRVIRKLFQPQRQIGSQSSGFGWMTWLYLLIYVLVAAAVVALILLIRHMVRSRRARVAPVPAEAIAPTVDLADETIGPDQLPEDGWTKLAHELLSRGELRLALRAFYLASLAQLAARHLITIARFKSNRDYERELLRRGHSWPDLLARFSHNVSTFDRIWYGMHPVDPGLVDTFAANVEAMRAAA